MWERLSSCLLNLLRTLYRHLLLNLSRDNNGRIFGSIPISRRRWAKWLSILPNSGLLLLSYRFFCKGNTLSTILFLPWFYYWVCLWFVHNLRYWRLKYFCTHYLLLLLFNLLRLWKRGFGLFLDDSWSYCYLLMFCLCVDSGVLMSFLFHYDRLYYFSLRLISIFLQIFLLQLFNLASSLLFPWSCLAFIDVYWYLYCGSLRFGVWVWRNRDLVSNIFLPIYALSLYWLTCFVPIMMEIDCLLLWVGL